MKKSIFGLARTGELARSVSASVTPYGVVLMFQPTDSSDMQAMYGTYNSVGQINWNASQDVGDAGNEPRIAADYTNGNTSNLVHIHETTNIVTSTLYTSTGQVDNYTGVFEWNAPQSMESGVKPDIAIDNKDVVVVYQSSRFRDATLYYKLGSLNSGRTAIDWKFGPTRLASGTMASVALFGDNILMVTIEGEHAHYYYGTIDFTTGVVDADKQDFPSFPQGVTAKNLSCALGSDGTVMIVLEHKVSEDKAAENEEYFHRMVFYGQTGSGQTITWVPGETYPPGRSSSISISGEYCAMANLGPLRKNSIIDKIERDEAEEIQAAVAHRYTQYDGSNWMSDYSETELDDLIIPGAHDAAMYQVQNCRHIPDSLEEDDTKTQRLTMDLMLRSGIRYFDIRPCWWAGGIGTAHMSKKPSPVGLAGCMGADLQPLLNEVRDFCASTSGQVVILKFSHYIDRDNEKTSVTGAQLKQAMDMAKQTLEDYLFYPWANMVDRLTAVPLEWLLDNSNNSVVLAIWDMDTRDLRPPSLPDGMFSYANYDPSNPNLDDADMVVFDQYSNTDKFSRMKRDQLEKLHNSANHGADLFLLSWTLTQSWDDAATGRPTILELGDHANAYLASTLANQMLSGQIGPGMLPNVVYVDDAGPGAANTCIWLNKINRQIQNLN